MALNQVEILRNIGDVAYALADASKEESDGGITITLSEVIDILARVGVSIVKDISDDDDN